MSVSAHLGIAIDEYDRRIRTFIPRYEEMLEQAARAIDRRARVIVDLGVGTGALAARCLKHAPRARVVGASFGAAGPMDSPARRGVVVPSRSPSAAR